jgi:sugar/nucleoside kinase (ribokinase family)
MHLGKMFPGGNALNFSVYARQSGAFSAYMGIFGDDPAACHIREVLDKLGVDTSRCRTFPGENGYARVTLIDGERVFLPGNKGGVSSRYPLKLSAEDMNYLRQFDLIHSSCYSFLEPEIPKMRELNVPFSFDFSDELDSDYLRRICPFIDFAFLSCGHLTVDQTREKLSECINRGCLYALGSRGTEGALLYDGERYFYQPARTVRALDTLGAGDSFVTSFLIHVIENSKKTGTVKPVDSLVLTDGLKKAAEAAAQTCLVQGAFGYGVPFEE